jgi:hypothetical protein
MNNFCVVFKENTKNFEDVILCFDVVWFKLIPNFVSKYVQKTSKEEKTDQPILLKLKVFNKFLILDISDENT